MYARVHGWDNLVPTWRRAAKGKHLKEPAARFEYHLDIGFRLVVAHDFPSLPEMPGGLPGCLAEARKPARSVPGRTPGDLPGMLREAASGPGE